MLSLITKKEDTENVSPSPMWVLIISDNISQGMNDHSSVFCIMYQNMQLGRWLLTPSSSMTSVSQGKGEGKEDNHDRLENVEGKS